MVECGCMRMRIRVVVVVVVVAWMEKMRGKERYAAGIVAHVLDRGDELQHPNHARGGIQAS